MKMKPCPKCLSTNKRAVPVKCYFDTEYKVRCSDCGFETDPFPSREEAQQVWNDLPRESEQECAVLSASGVKVFGILEDYGTFHIRKTVLFNSEKISQIKAYEAVRADEYNPYVLCISEEQYRALFCGENGGVDHG